MNEARQPWLDTPANVELFYSVKELYDKANKETIQVVNASEAFFADRTVDSASFFKSRQTVYLGKNYNLDTGLPSSLNTATDNQSEDPYRRFDYRTDILEVNLVKIG